jgi:subtilisin family serine protease
MAQRSALMVSLAPRALLLLGGAGVLALLAACGGGGGGVAPSPPPPVIGSSSGSSGGTTSGGTTSGGTGNAGTFETTEYRTSTGLPIINASTAYASGASGRGITIGIVDSGIDLNSPEFGSRISPASADVAGARGLQDPDGHGSYVAAIAAASKNDSGMHGVAFNSTLLIARSDSPGSCASTEGCDHNDNDIARGVDLAVNNGARVINMSLGGSPPNARLTQAMNRAAQAGVVLVFSAGNDGRTAQGANPDDFPLAAIQNPTTQGLTIAVGSYSASTNAISDFSNRGGTGAQWFLLAPGERIFTRDLDGTNVLVSGTSFAAPHAAGALALLMEAFPTLTGRQAVDLLLRSATDLGAAGTDPTNGRGLLNLAAAFRPQGPTAVAGAKEPAAVSVTTGNLTLGTPFGSGSQLGNALGGVTFLDSYGRAFTADFGPSLNRLTPRLGTRDWLSYDQERAASTVAQGPVSLFMTGRSGGMALPTRPDETKRLSNVKAHASVALTPTLRLGFAQGFGAFDLAGSDRQAGRFITGSSRWGFGAGQSTTQTLDLGFDWRGWNVSAAAAWGENRRAINPGEARQSLRSRDVVARAARGGETWRAGVTLGLVDEDGSVLGSLGTSGLTLGTGATTMVFGADGRWALSPHVSIGAQLLGGRTQIEAGRASLISQVDGLWLSSGALDISATHLFGFGDSLALRVSQPLRAEAGTALLAVPVSYDYWTGDAGYDQRRASLAADGRELAFELSYGRPLAHVGWMQVNLFHRLEPGHVAAAPADSGALVQLKTRF